MEVVQISSNDKKKDYFAQLSSDPNNKFWSNDKSRFGFKMLMKMGWSEGKGLGKNEQGMATYVKPTKNDEKSGLGEKEDKADWKLNSFNYNKLLSDLSKKYAPKPQTSENDSSSSSESESEEEKPKKKKKEEKPEPATESPKTTTKQADKIIFTKRHKAKQVSKYSKEDMKAILGIKDETKPAAQKETEFVSNIPVIVHKETMDEYFQKKLGENEEKENPVEEETERKSKKEKKEKKHKKEKKSKKEIKEESVEVETEENGKQDLEVKKEKKRKNKEIEEEVETEDKPKKEKKEKKEKKKRKHIKESSE